MTKIIFGRASICAADDVTDHKIELEFSNDSTLPMIMNKILDLKYLPEDFLWVMKDANGKEICAYYNSKNIFYANNNLTIEKLCLKNNIFTFDKLERYERKNFISKNEEHYAKSLKYKLYCIRTSVFMYLVILMFLGYIIFNLYILIDSFIK